MLKEYISVDSNRHSTIPINEKSYAAIEAYLKFLYTDKLEVDLHLAVGKNFYLMV